MKRISLMLGIVFLVTGSLDDMVWKEPIMSPDIWDYTNICDPHLRYYKIGQDQLQTYINDCILVEESISKLNKYVGLRLCNDLRLDRDVFMDCLKVEVKNLED